MQDAASETTEEPRSSKAQRRARAAELVRAYQETGERRFRNDLIELHLDLADYFSRRYSRRGVPAEELRQIALLAMVRCVDRFDLDQGVEFATFASRTVEGELKRHFRDKTWACRPPRTLQELHLRVRGAEDELTQRLGRSPTVAEVARDLGESVDDVLAAAEAGRSYYGASLDAPAPHDDSEGTTIGDVALAGLESGFDQVDVNDALSRVLVGLDERDRLIVHLRFFENRSQDEVAAAVGVSQSYLSRLLRKILDNLRQQLEHDRAASELSAVA